MYNIHSVNMSDPVQLALIAAVGAFVANIVSPSTIASFTNLIVTFRNHKENKTKLDKIETQTNGVVDKLVTAAKEQGKAEGLAEGNATTTTVTVTKPDH